MPGHQGPKARSALDTRALAKYRTHNPQSPSLHSSVEKQCSRYNYCSTTYNLPLKKKKKNGNTRTQITFLSLPVCHLNSEILHIHLANLQQKTSSITNYLTSQFRLQMEIKDNNVSLQPSIPDKLQEGKPTVS